MTDDRDHESDAPAARFNAARLVALVVLAPVLAVALVVALAIDLGRVRLRREW